MPFLSTSRPSLTSVVGGVPVAPRLTHRVALDRAEGAVAHHVDDQSVRQAVGVLVVDGVGLVAGVVGRERVAGGVRRAGLVLQVHLHGRRRAVGRRAHVGVVDVVAVGEAVVRGGAVHRLGLDRVVALALLVELVFSKLPAASVNPIGLASRWSWNRVDEVEDLGGVLLTVGLPRERLVRVPRAGEVLAEGHALDLEGDQPLVEAAAPPRSRRPCCCRRRRSRRGRCCPGAWWPRWGASRCR